MADVMVEFGAKIDSLISAVDQVKSKLGEVSESTSALAEGFSGIKDRIFEAFTVASILEFIHSMGELGLQTERTMAMLGTTAEQTLELGGIAALTGTSMDSLALSIERMTLNIQRSQRDAFTPAELGLNALGLRAKDLIGLPASEYFDKLHDAVSKFGAGLTTTNAVMAVGGRGVAQMMPLLLLSRDEWDEYKEAVARAREGLASAIPGMAQTHQSLTLLELAVQSFGARVFNVFQPAIKQAVDSLTKFVESLDTETISTAVDKIVDAASLAAKGIGTFFILAYNQVAENIGNIIATFGPLITALNAIVVGFQAMWDITTNAGRNLGTIFATALVSSSANVIAFQKSIDSATSSLKLLLNATEHEAAGLPEMADEMKEAAPAMAENAKQANAAIIKGYEDQAKAAETSFAQQKAVMSQQVVTFGMTQTQMDAQLITALGQRTAAQVTAWQMELSGATLTAAKRVEIQDKITEAVKKGITDQTNAQTKYVKDVEDGFVNMGNMITGTWNGQLKGLIDGTTTWATAMKNTWQNMVVLIIEQIEKVIIELAALAAAEALTGVAPTGGVTVANAIAKVFHFAEGTPYVPQTQLAVVHQGEMIIPPNMADAIRGGQIGLNGGGGDGGGNSLSISINALDAQSVQTWLRTGGAAMISRYFDQNPNARMRY